VSSPSWRRVILCHMPLLSIGGLRLIPLLHRARALLNHAVLLLAVRPLLRQALPPTAHWKTEVRAHMRAVPTPPRSSSARGGPSAPVRTGEETSTSEIPPASLFLLDSRHGRESFFSKRKRSSQNRVVNSRALMHKHSKLARKPVHVRRPRLISRVLHTNVSTRSPLHHPRTFASDVKGSLQMEDAKALVIK
jgi:hypothetical protein